MARWRANDSPWLLFSRSGTAMDASHHSKVKKALSPSWMVQTVKENGIHCPYTNYVESENERGARTKLKDALSSHHFFPRMSEIPERLRRFSPDNGRLSQISIDVKFRAKRTDHQDALDGSETILLTRRFNGSTCFYLETPHFWRRIICNPTGRWGTCR